MTTEFLEGDLVEAVKGESVVRGRANRRNGYLFLGDSAAIREVYQPDGWTLTLIDRPKPKVELPTEPGVYQGSLLGNLPMWLSDDGRWWTSRTQVHDPARHAPFTRLESRADTAKAVIDWFHLSVWGNHDGVAYIENARREFGVTSD